MPGLEIQDYVVGRSAKEMMHRWPRAIKIGVNVPRGRSNGYANFQLETSKVSWRWANQPSCLAGTSIPPTAMTQPFPSLLPSLPYPPFPSAPLKVGSPYCG